MLNLLYKLAADAIVGLLMSDSGLWLGDIDLCYKIATPGNY